MDKDPPFKAFLWHLLSSEASPQATHTKILQSAVHRCPPKGQAFCRAVTMGAGSKPVAP